MNFVSRGSAFKQLLQFSFCKIQSNTNYIAFIILHVSKCSLKKFQKQHFCNSPLFHSQTFVLLNCFTNEVCKLVADFLHSLLLSWWLILPMNPCIFKPPMQMLSGLNAQSCSPANVCWNIAPGYSPNPTQHTSGSNFSRDLWGLSTNIWTQRPSIKILCQQNVIENVIEKSRPLHVFG